MFNVEIFMQHRNEKTINVIKQIIKVGFGVHAKSENMEYTPIAKRSLNTV